MWPGALMCHIISQYLFHKQCIHISGLFRAHFGKFHQTMNGDASRCSLILVVKLLQPRVDFKHGTTEAVNNEL